MSPNLEVGTLYSEQAISETRASRLIWMAFGGLFVRGVRLPRSLFETGFCQATAIKGLAGKLSRVTTIYRSNLVSGPCTTFPGIWELLLFDFRDPPYMR